MEVQDLKVNILNRGYKEFNHLRVTNINKFLSDYRCNQDFYKAPYEILAELESKIKYENNPEEIIFCGYKDEGDVIFRLKRIYAYDDRRIVEYEFDTFIS